MIGGVKKNLDWFESKTGSAKVEIILILIIAVLGYYLFENQKTINTLRHEHKTTTNNAAARYDKLINRYYDDLEACKRESRNYVLKQTEKLEQKYEELFFKTDKEYQEIND